MIFVLVFLATAVADVFWTRYMQTVTAKEPTAAGLWSAGIIGLSAFTVVSYTSNHWLFVPAMAGAFVGTFFTVKKAR